VTNPTNLGIAAARDLLAKGEVSSRELAQLHLDAKRLDVTSMPLLLKRQIER